MRQSQAIPRVRIFVSFDEQQKYISQELQEEYETRELETGRVRYESRGVASFGLPTVASL